MLHTRKNFQTHRETVTLVLVQHSGCKVESEVLTDGATTNYHVTIYHRHLFTPTNNHTGISSQ